MRPTASNIRNPYCSPTHRLASGCLQGVVVRRSGTVWVVRSLPWTHRRPPHRCTVNCGLGGD